MTVRSTVHRRHRRRWGAGVAAIAAAGIAIAAAGAAPSSAAPARLVATTSGCIGVDGSAAPSGGPNRATVVVDTGSGPVWSACISFSGSISGVEALSRAEAVIVDLDPVFDTYTGLGRAVCKLRGVGTDPPDCLGKSVNYWSYSHDGNVSRAGAGAVTVHDGDVDGWRYGTGGVPRPATLGTRATVAVATTTTTRSVPTSAPTTPTTHPSGGTGHLGSSSGGQPSGSATSTSKASGATTTSVAAGSGIDDHKTSTTATASGSSGGTAPGSGTTGQGEGSTGSAADGGGGEQAGGAEGGATAHVDDGGGGSAIASAAGFSGAIAALGVAGLIVRRRRAVASGG